jgi:hypothetical protein
MGQEIKVMVVGDGTFIAVSRGELHLIRRKKRKRWQNLLAHQLHNKQLSH